MIISSQRHLDASIVADKSAAGDYAVLLSPEFEAGGLTVQVLLDGHHSYAACAADGGQLRVTVASATDHDAVGLLPDAEAFLEAVHMGDDYYDVATGAKVF